MTHDIQLETRVRRREGEKRLDDAQAACALQPLLARSAHSAGADTPVHSAFLIAAVEGDMFLVRGLEQPRQYRVKRAVSCLIRPERGDKVLVSGDAVGGLYIIAVLERGDAQDSTTLRVDGELVIAADTLSLQGTTRLDVATAAFGLKTDVGEVQAEHWTTTSQDYQLTSVALDVVAMTSKYTGTQRESFYQSVTETVGTASRYVTGVDTVQAVNIDYRADFIARLSADSTFINGETLVKADGKQILVG